MTSVCVSLAGYLAGWMCQFCEKETLMLHLLVNWILSYCCGYVPHGHTPIVVACISTPPPHPTTPLHHLPPPPPVFPVWHYASAIFTQHCCVRSLRRVYVRMLHIPYGGILDMMFTLMLPVIVEDCLAEEDLQSVSLTAAALLPCSTCISSVEYIQKNTCSDWSLNDVSLWIYKSMKTWAVVPDSI